MWMWRKSQVVDINNASLALGRRAASRSKSKSRRGSRRRRRNRGCGCGCSRGRGCLSSRTHRFLLAFPGTQCVGKATRRRQPVSQASAALRIEIGILTWASLLTYAANGGRLPRNCPRAKVIHAFSQSLMHTQRLPEEADGEGSRHLDSRVPFRPCAATRMMHGLCSLHDDDDDGDGLSQRIFMSSLLQFRSSSSWHRLRLWL